MNKEAPPNIAMKLIGTPACTAARATRRANSLSQRSMA